MADEHDIKLCECGCGQPTRLARQTATRLGWIRGQPIRFINGHNRNGRAFPTQRKTAIKRYRVVSLGRSKQMLISRALAEQAIGHALLLGAQIHHVDRDIGNAAPRLVICPDQAYHLLLHARERIVRAGGNPNTDLICAACKQPKPYAAFAVNRRATSGRHCYCRSCHAALRRRWR